MYIITENHRMIEIVKCIRLFRPQFRKVKIRFVVEIREVPNTLTPNAGVSDTPFR